MNIDFPPPSKGTYNNAGSCRRLANYLEHEDLERIEKGIYTEGFFNLEEDNLYKSQVIKDIDSNIGQLLKTDAKFYAIHVSPSVKELQAMGTTEAEQAEAMKRYIREVVIPEYAKNFNKGLSAEDIKFYGKIHFSRDRSNNELNMHCHLIVSRKDQSNKKKLSPLTNHKDTKKGAIKGGFDRTNLFKTAEQGFDKLFQYERPLTETFNYLNTMKNGSVSDQLKMQEKQISGERKNTQDNGVVSNTESLVANNHESKQSGITESSNSISQPSDNSVNQSTDSGLSSVFSIFSSPSTNIHNNEPQPIKPKKKRRRNRGLRS
jgi:ribosomal protein S15P/S13E